jgi:hypothetical protein
VSRRVRGFRHRSSSFYLVTFAGIKQIGLRAQEPRF